MEVQGSERFGHHLRRLRERRRMSLDKVEELSTDHLERITRSHLSRIENGQALPTLPRLMTLSRLYGEKLADLVERLEFDIQVESAAPIDVSGRTAEELEAEAKLEANRGDLTRAFHLIEAAMDELTLVDEETSVSRMAKLRLKLSTILMRAGKLTLCAEYAQSVLTWPQTPVRFRVWALVNLAVVYRKQRKLVLCRIFLDHILAHGDDVPPYHVADAKMLLAGLVAIDGDLEAACQHYSTAISLFSSLERPFEESKALKGLAKCHHARGQNSHALRFIDRQLALARKHGFLAEEGWGLQIKALIVSRRDDPRSASSLLRQSNEIARKVGHTDLLFTNHFHRRNLAKHDGDATLAASLDRVLKRLRSQVEEDLDEARAYDREVEEEQT